MLRLGPDLDGGPVALQCCTSITADPLTNAPGTAGWRPQAIIGGVRKYGFLIAGVAAIVRSVSSRDKSGLQEKLAMSDEGLFNLERKSAPRTDSSHLYWLHYRTLEAFIAKHLPQLPTPLLDLGCGSRPYKQLYPIGRVVGADVFAGKDVDVKLTLGDSLPFADGEFQAVFSTQVLEHIYDSDQFLNEAVRVTSRGGALLLTVPFVWELHEEPHDYFRFTQYWLEKKLKSVGYSSVQIEPQGGDIAMIGQAILLVMARRQRFLPRALLKLFNLGLDSIDRWSTTNHFPLNYGVFAIK
jgi:SAM-dependent methyltransferase